MQSALITGASALDDKLARFLYRFSRVGPSNISSFAEKFCLWAGLHELPRDPQVFLRSFGIVLEGNLLPRGIRAIWLRSGDTYRISYSKHWVGSLSLVLWHEFFEIMSANERFPTRLHPEMEERLAWLFAVNVMMPEAEIRRVAAELGHPERLDKTRVLASRFGVSASAMRLRLKELGLSGTATLRIIY